MHLHGTDKLPSELGATHSTAALVAAAVFVCAVAPIAEEFFFRGFIFGGLRNIPLRIGRFDGSPWLAAVITGILFGLAHTGSASSQYLIPLGFLGFVLCLVRWRTRSLYPCMALHSANNALALGVNQLSWSALAILGLIVASWVVIAVVVGPLAAALTAPRVTPSRAPSEFVRTVDWFTFPPMRRHLASCTAALAASIVSLGLFAGAAVANGSAGSLTTAVSTATRAAPAATTTTTSTSATTPTTTTPTPTPPAPPAAVKAKAKLYVNDTFTVDKNLVSVPGRVVEVQGYVRPMSPGRR